MTRERIQEIIARIEMFGHGAGYTVDEVYELASMALAAMDSEPVAYTDERNLGYIDRGRETAYLWGKQNSEAGDIPLYRHAQQPVVPEEMNFSAACNFVQINGMAKEDRVTLAMRVWNACRAAMLQAQSDDDGEPTDDERIMAIEGIHNCERCGDEGWVVGEMGITRCACGQAGNSPVIPDGLIAAVNRLLDSDGSRGCYSAIRCGNARFEVERLLAAAQHDTPALNSLQGVDSVAGKWIPVSERVPEDRISVILWDAEIGEVTSGHYSHKTQTFYHCGDAIENEITHWMPPPCAPQEVK